MRTNVTNNIVTVPTVGDLPATGQPGNIYIVLDDGTGEASTYIWDPNSNTWTNESTPVAAKPIVALGASRAGTIAGTGLLYLRMAGANYSSTNGYVLPFAAQLIGISGSTYDSTGVEFRVIEVLNPTNVYGSLTITTGNKTGYRFDLSAAIAAGEEIGLAAIRTVEDYTSPAATAWLRKV